MMRRAEGANRWAGWEARDVARVADDGFKGHSALSGKRMRLMRLVPLAAVPEVIMPGQCILVTSVEARRIHEGRLEMDLDNAGREALARVRGWDSGSG